ncbi:flagellar motor switch phosphatase FliY [Brevibacillus ginsengisoli]|uniref:flagellar motor switch phosphatase FliY n=1 Tax=Brevibacillus ginsengisoli TaxID=363854 RepID=UPI003CFB7D1D
MSRDMLSQDEIDALLRANNLSSDEEEPSDEGDVYNFLTAFEQDALGEIGNITFGSAATALSTLLNQKVDITTPTVSTIRRSVLESEFPRPHVAVHVEYTDGFKGINMLVIRVEDAAVIADLMMGGEGRPDTTDLSELHLSAVQEAMNQMMGSAATSMSTIFNKFVNITPPGIDVMDLSKGIGEENLPEDDTLIKVSFRLRVGEHGELIDSSIMQLLPVPFAKQMIDMLMGAGDVQESAPASEAVKTPEAIPTAVSTQEPIVAPMAASMPVQDQQGYGQQPPMQQPMATPGAPMGSGDPYAAHGYPGQPGMQPPMQGYPPYPYPPYPYPPQYQQPSPAPQHYGGYSGGNNQANVKPAQFSQFGQAPGPYTDEQNLGLLLDIPLQVTVELGRTKKLIKDILELSPGSIIQLDKLAGEPVDILVNNKLIAKGEVVVIDENFGVRVTDIISQWDRVQKLQ